ncbi:MAG: hypothetical protein KJO65_07895, partial [Gemmatimonadetes bacterium]|nr:hypothetical protein [Gemmatimonadota bacterium]
MEDGRMLAPEQLADLYKRHRKDPVLSIYLDADQQDFAERGKWRIALKTAVSEQREKATDAGQFDQAFGYLNEPLEESDGSFLSGRGWAGFA